MAVYTKIPAYFCVFCQPVLFLHYNVKSVQAYIDIEFVMEEKNTSKKSLSPKQKGILIIALNLLAMAAVVALLPYFALLWVDSYTNHDETHVVPDVCGVQLDDAVKTLGAEKLGYTIMERRYQENAAENEVIMQHPEQGSHVKEGRKIGLVINTTVKPNRSVPSVIDNRTFREAESHILAAGFVIKSVETIPGEKDWVYELRYNGKSLVNGEAIPQGSALVVVVGSGEEKEDDTPIFETNFDI